jgi:hypothetical protein
MPWYPFCCIPASWMTDFDEKPDNITEIDGEWTYGESEEEDGVFATSSSRAILAYSCEVLGSPMVQFKLVDAPTSGGVRVYLRATSDFASYICGEITPLGLPDDEDRKCANLRIYTETGLIYTTTVNYNALVLAADGVGTLSMGLDLSDEEDPRFVCNFTTISLAEFFPDGLDGYGHFVGFGTSEGNDEEISFYDVTVKSYNGNCCGPMPNPLMCDEHNPCGGDGIGGTTPIHGLEPIGGTKVGDYWYSMCSPAELDWWSFVYDDNGFSATFTIPSDRCGVTYSDGKCHQIVGIFRVTTQDAGQDCQIEGVPRTLDISLGIGSVQDALGKFSRIRVEVIEGACKGHSTVQTAEVELSHTGAGAEILDNVLDVCQSGTSIMCNQVADESLFSSLQAFPMGFIRIKITITFDDGHVCKAGIGEPDLLYQAGGSFVINVSQGGAAILPIEPC